MYRYKNNQVDRYTTLQGLASNSIYQMLQDRSGAFWLSGPDSITSLPESALDGDYPLHEPLAVTRYQLPYEADGAQMYGGRQPAGYLAPDDTVWFPTNQGAAHVMAKSRSAPINPVVRIDSVSEDGRKVAFADPL